MPINQRYLNNLGVSDDLSRKGLINAYNALFKTEQDINSELLDVLGLSTIAVKKELEIASSLGLGLQNNQSAHWNRYFNCYEMTAQLEDKGFPTITPEGQAYFTADGRNIKTSIQLSASNTNFNPNDVKTMFEDAYAAARELATSIPQETQKQKYLDAIARVYAEFATEPGTMIRVRTPASFSKKLGLEPDEFAMDSVDKIMKDFYDGILRRKKDNVIDITHRTQKLNNSFINRLAMEIARAQKNEPDYIPENSKQLTELVKLIRNKEIELNASKRRPILVNIYPTGANQWIMRTYIPNSDEPSTLRKLERGMFSNDWNGEVELITKYANGTFQRSKVFASKDRRSSSIAVLTHTKNKKEHDIEFQKVYTAFKNMVVQYARDELIASLNAGNPIPAELIIKEAYITLLSPIKGHVGFANLPGIFTNENEYSQLQFTRKCLESIALETLTFSPQDREYIETHSKIKPTDIHKLEGIKIKHRSYFSNYIVNKYLGVHLEKLDRPSLSLNKEDYSISYKKPKNYRYFIEGNYARQQDIIEFIKKDRYASAEVQKKLIAMLAENPIKDRVAFEDLIKDNSIIVDLRILLETYLNIEKYFHGESTGISRSRLVASYIMAAEDAVLADILGYTAHHTCKSGIDRTGLLSLIKEARLPAKLDAEAEEEFIQRLLTALKLGNSREIKTMNDPAARGLQIPSSVMDGHDEEIAELEQFLKDQNFNMIGKSKKNNFKVTETSFRDAKDSMQRADAASALIPPKTSVPAKPPVNAATRQPPPLPLTAKPKPTISFMQQQLPKSNTNLQGAILQARKELKKSDEHKQVDASSQNAFKQVKLRVVNPENPRFPPTKPQ